MVVLKVSWCCIKGAWAAQCNGRLRLPILPTEEPANVEISVLGDVPEQAQMVAGCRDMFFDPADVEVVTPRELCKEYWCTRDVTMNECVVLRSAPDRVVLYYTADALADASVGRIRAATRCLFNNYCFMWMCDPQTGQPILAPDIIARCVLRLMKGHGATVELDEATLHFYRRSGGLAQKTVFQILKPFLVEGGEMAQQARAISAAEWLQQRGLLNPLALVEDVVLESASQLTMLVRVSSTGAQMSVEKRNKWSARKRAQVHATRQKALANAPLVGFVAADTQARVDQADPMEIEPFDQKLVRGHASNAEARVAANPPPRFRSAWDNFDHGAGSKEGHGHMAASPDLGAETAMAEFLAGIEPAVL
jgi:hypothetical protein